MLGLREVDLSALSSIFQGADLEQNVLSALETVPLKSMRK
jgi:hypothetical protein